MQPGKFKMAFWNEEIWERGEENTGRKVECGAVATQKTRLSGYNTLDVFVGYKPRMTYY